MRTLLKRLYSIYGVIIFFGCFLILLVPFLVIIPVKKWHRFTGLLNRIWSNLFFFFLLIPVRNRVDPTIDKSKNYIFCPNHFSYLDIPTMGYTFGDFIFVGKNAMEKVPLFGYMYKKLHITVNRASLKSKHNTYVRAKQALEESRSLVMFPEGGVLSTNMPKMASFKNGAFKLAIEKQIPIIPVTIPHNWIILPDDDRFLIRWGVMKVIYHAPIETKGMTMSDLPSLIDKVFNVIQLELEQCNENR